MRWTALVLAGSRGPDDPVASAAGVAEKALAPIGGRAMIAYVLDALTGSAQVAETTVAINIDLDAVPEASGIATTKTAKTPATSVLEGFDRLSAPLVVTTGDAPFLTSEMLDRFLVLAGETGADAVAAIAPKTVVEAAGNPGKRTYLKFRDGAFSGCNLFAFPTSEGRAAISFWRKMEAERKRPWRMAREIGLGTLVLYLARSLSTTGLAARLGKRAGCRVAFVQLNDPLAAHDVDKPADLAFARKVLETSG